MDTPLLSVCLITYNHKDFIRQAIDGVLMQEVDFSYELIIADDFSTDGTRDILLEYKAKYPDVIKLILQECNIGPAKNWMDLITSPDSKVKYIAYFEGDDYWTDTLKLQKQVDFLESNLNYSICFHKVKILRDDTFLEDTITEARYNNIKELPASVEDLLTQGNFINTASAVFRNNNIKFPFEFSYSTVGDYFLHIINAQYGFIKQLDEVMSVYRKGVGVYSGLPTEKMLEKIIIYQTCILSYLKNNDHKEILLDKTIKTIKELVNISTEKEYLARVLSFKSLFRIALLKLKKKAVE
ncbi:glycosyltransferase [Algibacter sp. 2305UL17-15]|uniref:glycosyltransferase family 2 protein n=1 Tax=Algibacter sp. 2305UL17-15 TaxID=3231268 RepID=UPI003457E554